MKYLFQTSVKSVKPFGYTKIYAGTIAHILKFTRGNEKNELPSNIKIPKRLKTI